MKIKRSQIEELILLISPDTDVHLFPKRDLLAVLKHEILHLLAQKDPARFNAAVDESINALLAKDEIPPHIRNRMPEMFGRHILSFPIHATNCPAVDGFGCRCNG